MDSEAHIKQKALDLGFDRVGITTAEPISGQYAQHYQHWLDDGCAAGMGYLHRNNDKRFAPDKLLIGAQSVICVALNYRPHPSELPPGRAPAVARFALYDDYHGFIKSRLNELAEFIRSLHPDQTHTFKACADAIPLAERALARRAGLGFIGRNHFLIHPELGGQVLLGELLTTLPLTADAPIEGDFCGPCRACITACPTGALSADGGFDARKCLSYLTIEEAGDIPDAPARRIDACLFGCDICLTACPYENDAPPRSNKEMNAHRDRATLMAEDILHWTEADFEARCKNSCLQRSGLKRLLRNAKASIRNKKNADPQ